MDKIKKAAIDMLDAGLSVVPVRKNKKSIGGWTATNRTFEPK